MTYQEWTQTHKLKHYTIIKIISNLSKEKIIKYFDFENMKNLHEDFCLLYKTNTKCHNLESLNCYICGCPYFRFDEKKSYCSINSKSGKSFTDSNGYSHQDCSDCTLPHSTEFVSKNFELDWSKYIK